MLRVQVGAACQGSAWGTNSTQQTVTVMMPLGRKGRVEWGLAGPPNLIEPSAGCFSEMCL